jgi:translation elongation factor EF-Ts
MRRPVLPAVAAFRMSSLAAAKPSNMIALVRELRERTGASLADVRSSLAAASWDINAALDILHERGLAAAAKAATRTAADGLVAVAASPTGVALIELNSETDFVSRSEPFARLAAAVAEAAMRLAGDVSGSSEGQELDLERLRSAPLQGPSQDGPSVSAACTQLAASVRENVQLRRAFWLATPPGGGAVCHYVHAAVAPGAGRIAAAVALHGDGAAAAAAAGDLGPQLAMQVRHPAGCRHASLPVSVRVWASIACRLTWHNRVVPAIAGELPDVAGRMPVSWPQPCLVHTWRCPDMCTLGQRWQRAG